MAGLQQEPPRVRGGNNHTSAVDLSFFNCKDYDHQDMNQVMKLEILIAILVFVMAGCFFGEMGHVRPAAADVLKCMFIHKHSGDGTVGDAIALFGALVMQHNLFLHSGHFLTWKIPNSVCGINCSTWFLALRQEGEVDQEEGKPSKHHCVLSAVSLSRRISGAAAAAVDSQFPLSSAATSRYLFVEGEGAGAVAAHHAHTRVSALMRFSRSYTLIF